MGIYPQVSVYPENLTHLRRQTHTPLARAASPVGKEVLRQIPDPVEPHRTLPSSITFRSFNTILLQISALTFLHDSHQGLPLPLWYSPRLPSRPALSSRHSNLPKPLALLVPLERLQGSQPLPCKAHAPCEPVPPLVAGPNRSVGTQVVWRASEALGQECEAARHQACVPVVRSASKAAVWRAEVGRRGWGRRGWLLRHEPWEIVWCRADALGARVTACMPE